MKRAPMPTRSICWRSTGKDMRGQALADRKAALGKLLREPSRASAIANTSLATARRYSSKPA